MVSLLSQSNQFPGIHRDPETQEVIETYIVNFLFPHVLEGIELGIINKSNPEYGYSLPDVKAYDLVNIDFQDFTEKFGVDETEAWLIFIRKTSS